MQRVATVRVLFAVTALLAAATALNAFTARRNDVAIALAVVAVAVAGAGLRLVLMLRRNRGPEGTLMPSDALAPTERVSADSSLDAQLLPFAEALVGATSLDHFRRAVMAHLPHLLGSQQVWITGRTREGRRVVVPEQPDGFSPEDYVDTLGREWTTFALRADQDSVGVLGVESPGGLRPQAQRIIERVSPLIARALSAAQTVDSLREKSLVDLLTGLATRHEGITRLESEIKRSQRAGTTMAVLMLDLDRFKAVNDRYGHPVGDALLVAVGQTIRRTLRASDLRVRWGGEEFLIVLPETDLPRAQVVAGGLLREIAASAVPTDDGPVASTVSIGVTLSRAGETDPDAMIRRADAALYHAKNEGRACIRVVLGDRVGLPVPAVASAGAATAPLPFPERRNPRCGDRRTVPSAGRRGTDPATQRTSQRRSQPASA